MDFGLPLVGGEQGFLTCRAWLALNWLWVAGLGFQAEGVCMLDVVGVVSGFGIEGRDIRVRPQGLGLKLCGFGLRAFDCFWRVRGLGLIDFQDCGITPGKGFSSFKAFKALR